MRLSSSRISDDAGPMVYCQGVVPHLSIDGTPVEQNSLDDQLFKQHFSSGSCCRTNKQRGEVLKGVVKKEDYFISSSP